MDTSDKVDKIAVIGMACRFPGAAGVQEFWQNLRHGKESITEFEDNDILAAGVDAEILNNPLYVKKGFILEDEDKFDAAFFGYSPTEAELMDPQHRLFLETAWHTFEDAGYSPENFPGDVGIFAGSRLSTYLLNQMPSGAVALNLPGFQALLGNDKDYLTSRVAYKMNLKGPCVTVQTACSSSLVAVHMACESLLSGGCDMALAGGVALTVPQKVGYLFQQGMVLSQDGHCRAFDANATGLVPGNGVGAVLLKRLHEAIEDRDNIHAVILGSAINNDGSRKAGYTAPSVAGQSKVICEALDIAGVEKDTITYIETHGTGTALGDPVEIEALALGYGKKCGHEPPCAIGSVKTNIGHLDTAAGVASLIKTILALKNAELPPSLNFTSPNSHIDFGKTRFYVNTALSEWKKNGSPRRAGVSSFGFGGTNAHMILEEAPERPAVASVGANHLLVLSAKSEEALREHIQQFCQGLDKEGESSLPAVCLTAGVGRSHFPFRAAAIGKSVGELKAGLSAFLAKELPGRAYARAAKADRAVLVFPGAEGWTHGMGRELFSRFPAFAREFEHCGNLFREICGLSPMESLWGMPAQVAEIRALVFALEYSLGSMWRGWGAAADKMLGVGVGEYVAACLAGVFSLEDGIRLLSGAPADGIRFSLPRVALLSATTGKELEGDVVASAAFWSAPKADDADLLGMDAAGEDGLAVVLGPGKRHSPKNACTSAANGLHVGMDEERYVLECLQEWYLNGFTVDWAAFYKDRPACRVSMPGYPFRKKRYWFDGNRKKIIDDHALPQQRGWEKNLPFSGCKLDCAPLIFQFRVEPHDCPSIKEHRVHGIAMVPAGAWWEMLLSSGAMLFDGRAAVIKDLMLHRPLLMREGRGPLVQIVFEQKAAGMFSFTAFSDDAGTGESRAWHQHMTGRLMPSFETEDAPEPPLDCCRERCGSPLNVADFKEKLAQTDYVSDHTWNWWTFTEVRVSEQEALSRVSFTAAFMKEACRFARHPSLIDPCLQTLLAIPLNENPELLSQKAFMPIRFGNVLFLSQPSEEMYCHTAIRPGGSWRDDDFTADFHLFAPDGRLIAAVEGVEMKNTHLPENAHNDAYTVQWQVQAPVAERTSVAGDECWLVIGNNKNVAEQLCSLILESGHEATVLPDELHCGAGMSELLAERLSVRKGMNVNIILLQETSALREGVDPAEAAVEGQIKAVSLLQTIKASRAAVARFCVVTCGAVAVLPEDSVAPHMAPLWGFCRVAAQEHPDMGFSLVDLASGWEGQTGSIRLLWDTLRHQGNESETALRNNQVYVPRLRRLVRPARAGSGDCQDDLDGTFLVTGGLGGVGLRTAAWLAEQGARRIVLMGRNDPDNVAQKTIDKLADSGAQIIVRKGDAACGESLAAVLDEIRAAVPPLKGVFHLAGVVEQRLLLEQSPENIKENMSAKVEGAWNLHRLTMDDPLEFFVLFSSLSTLMGGAGSGNYAAANIFLDALAHFRSRQGLPALSVNWGPFSEVGMLADDTQGHLARKQMGIHSFLPAQALSRMADHWTCAHPQVCIAHVDWDAYAAGLGKNVPPLFSCLATASSREPEQAKSADAAILDGIMAGSEEQREKLLTQFLTAHVAELLGLDIEEVPGDADFIQLGMDSLIFINLSSVLSKKLNVRVTSHEFSQFSTVGQLARHIMGGLNTQKGNDGAKVDVSECFVLHADPENRFEPFDLTDIQQAYWVGRSGMLGMGRISCHGYSEYDFDDLDPERFQKAWRRLIQRHEMLRAVVLPEGRQKILETVPDFVIPVYNLAGLGDHAAGDRLAEVRSEMSHQIFASDQWPLFDVRISRLGGVHSIVHMSMDFLLTDAHSMRNLFEELWHYYNNPDVPLPALTLSFRDYVLSEKSFRDSPVYQASRQYWMERLDTIPGAPELPTVKTLEDVDSPVFVRRRALLEAAGWKKVKNRASTAGVTPSGILMAAYAEVLAVWSKSSHFCINITLFNRLPVHEQINDIFGDFTSLTFLEVDMPEGAGFEARARHIQNQMLRDMEHRWFSGVQVLRELGKKAPGNRVNIMPVVFTSNLIAGMSGKDTGPLGKAGKIRHGVSQTPQVWLDLQVHEDGGDLVIFWDALEEIFPENVLEDMFHAFVALLERLADDPAVWDAVYIPMVPQSQLDVRARMNDTGQPVEPCLLHELFTRQCRVCPEKEAVVAVGRTMSYAEVAGHSDVLARELRQKGAVPDSLVAVVMEKGWEQVVAVLAILKSGAAYLPIAPDTPKKRLEFMLMSSNVTLVLTQPGISEKVCWPEGVEIRVVEHLSGEGIAPAPLESVQTPDQLAYVIFTSGSTGQPKGVMIDHKGAVNTITDINERFAVGPDDRVLALSKLNFDLSVYDIFGILAAGGTVIMPDPSADREPARWMQLLRDHRVTLWNSVPALMQMLVTYAEERKENLLPSVRLALLSGDWIPTDLPQKIRDTMPDVELVSLGGATEASIWSILFPIQEDAARWPSIPYGHPMKNQRFHVLDAQLMPCPDWVVGEMYIGGAGLAKGYWQDRKKTDDHFILHPLTHERLYRTGDMGYYRPDGNIMFMGREDFQVKIGGHRIELGEIEATARQLPVVRDCAVTVMRGQNDARLLVGHMVPQPGSTLSASTVQAYLAERLPAYMVPTYYSFSDKLPLTANGKVDLQALSQSEVETGAQAQRDEHPDTGIEDELAEIFANVLQVNTVGMHDSFFILGGDSLTAIRIVNKIKARFNIDLSIASLLEAGTVFKTASLLMEQGLAVDAVDDFEEGAFIIQ